MVGNFAFEIRRNIDVYGNLCIDKYLLSKICIYKICVKKSSQKIIGVENKNCSSIVKGYAELDKESLNFIEKIRDKDNKKDVKFTVSLNISYLEKSYKGYIIGYERITRNALQEKATIKSSDWVHDYAPKFGIGNFMILEIPIDLLGNNIKLKTNAATALNNALYLVSKAEKEFMSMDSRRCYVLVQEIC